MAELYWEGAPKEPSERERLAGVLAVASREWASDCGGVTSENMEEHWRALADAVIAARADCCVDREITLAALTRERDQLRAALREIRASGVEFEDERVPYVSVQITRELWDELAAIATEPTP